MKDFLIVIGGFLLVLVIFIVGFSNGWDAGIAIHGKDCDALNYFIVDDDDGYHKYECRLIATSSTKDHYDWVTE